MSGSSRDCPDFIGMNGCAQGCGNAPQAVRSFMI